MDPSGLWQYSPSFCTDIIQFSLVIPGKKIKRAQSLDLVISSFFQMFLIILLLDTEQATSKSWNT